ncbi:MAG: hypothetical protein K2W95_22190 [Candidatus Obscuribacterales bacterium]|nr:hypothetical protein [Candidatus Obscuribacterales bacterium]
MKIVRNCLRSRRAASLLEFCSSFTVLILFVFLPLINLGTIFSIFSAATTLNDIQVRQASLIDYKETLRPGGPVKEDLPRAWERTGLAAYAGHIGKIETAVGYSLASTDKYGTVDCWVTITTKLRLKPFLTVPGFPAVIPGLNAPFDISIRSRKLLEDPTHAPPLTALSGGTM